ncbi:MAG: type I-MYXAN CRISPR-associated endonuclease Cas1, partial [Deltaproteobacteria bacterium]
TGLAGEVGDVQRRIRQYRALSDPGTCLRLARKLVTAKVEGYLRYLLRATRGRDREALGVTGAVAVMREALRGITRAEGVEILRGHEGQAARAWFEVLPALLSERVPGEMRPAGRSRRPPRDRFNALLGYGYALLHQVVMQAVLVVGLEPALGFYHTPRSPAHPLVLDLLDLFRLLLWDIPLIGSVNRGHWDVEGDFEVAATGRVWLSASGRKKAIELFERRLGESYRHPVIGYSLSYRRQVELEVRLLEKEWSGQPGLFARMRLR